MNQQCSPIEIGRTLIGVRHGEKRLLEQSGKLSVKQCGRQQIVTAYETETYSYQQIADFYGLHITTVGKILRKAREWWWMYARETHATHKAPKRGRTWPPT